MPEQVIEYMGYKFPVFIPDDMAPSFQQFRDSDYWKFVNKAERDGALGIIWSKKRSTSPWPSHYPDLMAILPALFMQKTVGIFSEDERYVKQLAETAAILLQRELRMDKVFRKEPRDNRRIVFDEISWEPIGYEYIEQTNKHTGYRLSVVQDIDNSFHPHETF